MRSGAIQFLFVICLPISVITMCFSCAVCFLAWIWGWIAACIAISSIYAAIGIILTVIALVFIIKRRKNGDRSFFDVFLMCAILITVGFS